LQYVKGANSYELILRERNKRKNNERKKKCKRERGILIKSNRGYHVLPLEATRFSVLK
jgi:hypothetical protein